MFDLLARIISITFSPPILVTHVMYLLFLRRLTGEIFWVRATLLLIVELGILTYYVYLFRTKQISDLHISNQKERNRLYVFCILFLSLMHFVFHIIGQEEISRFLILFVVGLATFLGVNQITKISAHMAAVTLWVLVGIDHGWSFFAFLCIPFVGWARIKRKRHTFMQVILGTSVSFILYMIGKRWVI